MKMTIYFIVVVSILFSNSIADEIPSSIVEAYQKIVSLIKVDDAPKLAELIIYPLKREYPLPEINSPDEFVNYYQKIFDAAFKKKFENYADSCIFERHGFYGLVGGPFRGEIWITEEGKIMAIHYLSSEESKLKDRLYTKIKNQLHPSVCELQRNVLIAKYKSLTIRVDRTDKGLRYASWSKGHLMSEEPDLILYNGIEESQGTMGGWTWTFNNEEWTYLIDDVEACEDPEQCGLFLILLFNGTEKSRMKLIQINL